MAQHSSWNPRFMTDYSKICVLLESFIKGFDCSYTIYTFGFVCISVSLSVERVWVKEGVVLYSTSLSDCWFIIMSINMCTDHTVYSQSRSSSMSDGLWATSLGWSCDFLEVCSLVGFCKGNIFYLCINEKYHGHTHTHTHIYIYIYIVCVCLCVSSVCM